MRWLVAAAALLLLPAMATAEPAPLAAYMGQPRAQPDVVIRYGEAPSQVIELFRPTGKGPHPVVVLLHGGCYLREFEGLAQTSGVAADLARRGYAVWNVEYRRLPEAGAGYPGTFQDVGAAIDRLRDEAKRYDLDASRVVGLGHSAGGHLALWAAARAKLPKDSPLYRAQPLKLAAAISLAGIGDIEGQGDVFSRACGADTFPKMVGQHLADTSPAKLLPTGVPVVLIQGAYDHVMPPFTALQYAEQVRKAGDKAQVITIPDAGHFDVVIPTTAAWETVADAVAAAMPRRR